MDDQAILNFRAYTEEVEAAYDRWFPPDSISSNAEVKKAEAGYYAECARIRERYFGKPKPRKKSKR